VRFGVFLPPFEEFADARRVMSLAAAAEDAGWDGFFLWDHMLARPGMAVAEAWVTMAAVATATTRMRIGALVTPLPRRRPWVLARQIATLDGLSRGRLIAGIGLGDDGWKEFSAFGDETSPLLRGEMLDESLDLLQRLLGGDAVRFEGSHYDVDTTPFLPRPQQNPLPIWGAVRWPNRKPLMRIAHLQGCFPIFASSGPPPPPVPDDIVAIRRAIADLGGSPDIDIAIRCALSLQDSAAIPETVASLEEAGVTWILEAVAPGEQPESVERVVRQGPPKQSDPKPAAGVDPPKTKE
jgi:alkanesulfonate monooxygenase SsuD/methylene tetrahydromethanopterin reductase-like flavin-dependent oxidoreductase (luciferase family)